MSFTPDINTNRPVVTGDYNQDDFKRYDVDDNGTITEDELREIGEREGLSQVQIESLITAFGDGGADLGWDVNEFGSHYTEIKKAHSEALSVQFSELSDGEEINYEQFKAQGKAKGMTENEINAAWKALNGNENAGAGDTVTKEEFMNNRGKMSTALLNEKFGQIATNNDDKLSFDEFKAYAEKEGMNEEQMNASWKVLTGNAEANDKTTVDKDTFAKNFHRSELAADFVIDNNGGDNITREDVRAWVNANPEFEKYDEATKNKITEDIFHTVNGDVKEDISLDDYLKNYDEGAFKFEKYKEFATFDKDSNGAITKEEFVELAKNRGMSEEKANELWGKASPDNSEITMDEFMDPKNNARTLINEGFAQNLDMKGMPPVDQDQSAILVDTQKKDMIDQLPQYVSKWGGEDGLVSKNDLKNIAGDNNRPEAERKLAQYLLDNENVFNELELASGGADDDMFDIKDVEALQTKNGWPTESQKELTVMEKLPGFMENWGGEDGLVSKKDLEAIAKDPARSPEERQVAQYLLTHESEFNKLEMASGGGDDDMFSLADVKAYNSPKLENLMLDKLPGFMENWGGEDGLVSMDDLKAIAADPNRSQEERLVAQYFVDNPAAFDELELASGGKDDGLFSADDVKKYSISVRQEQLIDKLPGFMEKWGGDDDLVSKKDLEAIASDKSRPKEERDLAQFLLDNEDIFNKLELASGGKDDDMFSSADIKEFKNQVREQQMFDKLPGFMKNWGGDDGLVSKKDLQAIADDPARSKTERDIAQYLLDNEKVFEELELANGGENDDMFNIEDLNKYKEKRTSS